MHIVTDTHALRRAWRALILAALVVACGAIVPTRAAASSTMPSTGTQVRVEARVLEWKKDASREVDFAVRYTPNAGSGSVVDGMDLTLPANPALDSAVRVFLSGVDAGSGSFDGMIEALETAGSVKILSQPSIILTSPGQLISEVGAIPELQSGGAQVGYDAKISNTIRIPYESTHAVGAALASITQYRDSGVTMDVSVPCVDGNLIVLDMLTQVTELTGYISVGTNSAQRPMSVPTLDARMLQNRVIVPDRTVFIAGLIKTTRSATRKRGIPWLSEIPLLGALISSHYRAQGDSELVFLVKPEILTPEITTARATVSALHARGGQ